MFEKVLLPTDFSESAEKAKNSLLALGEVVKSVTLLSVIDSRLFSYSTMIDEIEIDNLNIQGQIYNTFQDKLKDWQSEFKEKNIEADFLITEGIPLDEILNEAEKGNYSAVVVGEKGQTAGEKILLGSTAEKIVRKAKQTVIIVK